jgi:catechol 2,3-dioxygenase-like lactoylglutathione lyase family enzyme
MPIAFNHTIVAAHDKRASAEFVSELFGLPSPQAVGHFLAVALEYGATLDYVEVADGQQIAPQHYAFLVSEDDFDAIYGKISSRGLQHWADPAGPRPGEFNTNDGGRGVYFRDPAGHYLEILTRPYGSGS